MLFYSVKPSAFIRQRFGGRVADLVLGQKFSVAKTKCRVNLRKSASKISVFSVHSVAKSFYDIVRFLLNK